MKNMVTELLEKEKNYLKDEYEKRCSEISDIEGKLEKGISFDEAFSRIKKSLHNTIPENMCYQLVKGFDELGGYCSIDVSAALGEEVYIACPMLIVRFAHYSIAFSLKPDDDKILVRFASADLTFEKWVKEMIACEKIHFNDFEEFKGYQYSSSAYYNYCSELSKLEEFAKDPTFKNYCKMKDISYSPLAFVKKEIYAAYKTKLETCISDKGWLVSLIKLEKEKYERFEYGLEQARSFYDEALPPLVKLLKGFTNIEERLTVLNKPIGDMLKQEILIRIGVIPRENESVLAKNIEENTDELITDSMTEAEGDEKEDDTNGDSICI